MTNISEKTYAQSLINAENDFKSVKKDLDMIMQTLSNSEDLSDVLLNPAISAQAKNDILESVFKNNISEKVLNFLKILVEKKRFKELDGIVKAYDEKTDEIENIQRVEIISAVELSNEQKQKLTEKLKAKYNKNITAEWHKNKDIIGGLIIKSGDDTADYSILNRFEKLSKI